MKKQQGEFLESNEAKQALPFDIVLTERLHIDLDFEQAKREHSLAKTMYEHAKEQLEKTEKRFSDAKAELCKAEQRLNSFNRQLD